VTAPPTGGGASTSDAARSAAGDVKDTAAQNAADVKDTAKQQAGEVTDHARQQAGQVKDTAASAAQDVAATAREQAQNVVGEASAQARQVAQSLTSQLNEQAGTQQQRAASNLRSLADGVNDMVEGRGAPSGPVGDYTRQVADRLQSAAGYLENKQPRELLDDVRGFAGRRPGAFLLGAAIAGFAVGRLVKGASGSSDSGSLSGTSGSAAPGSIDTGSLGGPVGAGTTGVTPAPGTVPSPGVTAPPPVTSPAPTAPVGGGLAEPYPTDDVYGRRPLRDPALGPDEVDPLAADPYERPLEEDLFRGSPGGGPGV
jgi:uncharacterized protein YjbJ (UPF0337 family)